MSETTRYFIASFAMCVCCCMCFAFMILMCVALIPYVQEQKYIRDQPTGCIFKISSILNTGNYTDTLLCIKDSKTSTNFTVCHKNFCIDKTICNSNEVCDELTKYENIYSYFIYGCVFLGVIMVIMIVIVIASLGCCLKLHTEYDKL